MSLIQGGNMLKITALFLLIASGALQAKTTELLCEVSYNRQQVFQKKVGLQDHAKNLHFGDFEEFSFFISSKGDNVIELQTLNHNEPSRTYATGLVNSSRSYIDLAVWKREYLLEVRCSL